MTMMEPDWWLKVDPIRGWLTLEEAICLHALARDRKVLELGSYCGRSTVSMALSADVVVSVDHHMGDNGTGPGYTLPEFIRNLERCGVRDKVIPIVTTTEKANSLLVPAFYDLVFIDASHEYPSVCHDIALAKKMVKPNGTIAFHDYGSDVQQAAEDCDVPEQFHMGSIGWLYWEVE
jgi:predicted O-methyltransferase YrrM